MKKSPHLLWQEDCLAAPSTSQMCWIFLRRCQFIACAMCAGCASWKVLRFSGLDCWHHTSSYRLTCLWVWGTAPQTAWKMAPVSAAQEFWVTARIKHRFPLFSMHKMLMTSLFGLGIRDCVTDPVQSMNICRAMLSVMLLPCNVHSHMKVQFYQFFVIVYFRKCWRQRCRRLSVFPTISSLT